MSTPDPRQRATKRLLYRLLIVVLAMFGFGYALVPLYNHLCSAIGFNGKTERATAADVPYEKVVDPSRYVTVQFTGNSMAGLPWTFHPLQKQVKIHPGQVDVIKYYARNDSNETIVAQAVPSVTPSIAAVYFKKIQCFCFTRQTLKPGESKVMPVRFFLRNDLPKDVNTVTLSYAFYNVKTRAARTDGGGAQPAAHVRHDHDHARPAASDG